MKRRRLIKYTIPLPKETVAALKALARQRQSEPRELAREWLISLTGTKVTT